MKSAIKQPPAPDNQNLDKAEESEEDDYMSMILPDPSTLPKTKETSIQRRQRLRREAEERGRVKSKAEREAAEKEAREIALRTSLISSSHTTSTSTSNSNEGAGKDLTAEELKRSKGLAMMAKMGFRPGMVLGKVGGEGGRSEPIGVEIKEGRGGVGMDSEKKRRWREEVEREGKRVKVEEEGYRERVRREREDKRLEGLVGSAMRIAERLDGEREDEERENREDGNGGGVGIWNANGNGDERKDRTLRRTKPLKKINILYRGLIRQREEAERTKRMRNDLQQSLSHPSYLPSYNDDSLSLSDKIAYDPGSSSTTIDSSNPSSKPSKLSTLSKLSELSGSADVLSDSLIQEEELEEEDEELEAFNSLEPKERLGMLVKWLRDEFWYCFWCKFRYGEGGMEGCPGVEEEDHD